MMGIAHKVQSVYTVVIPAIPGDVHLHEALDSIEAQTLPADAVYVVVDERHDVDPAWRALVEDRSSSVNVITHAGRGMALALAAGIANAETPYVAFLDCDDLWRSEKQARQIDLLESAAEVDAAICMAANVRTDDAGMAREWESIALSGVDGGVKSCMFTCTTFRRSVFDRFGVPDASASHYTWLYRWWSQARDAGIVSASIDYVGLHRRIHGSNSWAVGNSAAHHELLGELRQIVAQRRSTSVATATS